MKFFGRVRESHSHINRFNSFRFIHLPEHFFPSTLNVEVFTNISNEIKRTHATTTTKRSNWLEHTYWHMSKKGTSRVCYIKLKWTTEKKERKRKFMPTYTQFTVRDNTSIFLFSARLMGFSHFFRPFALKWKTPHKGDKFRGRKRHSVFNTNSSQCCIAMLQIKIMSICVANA